MDPSDVVQPPRRRRPRATSATVASAATTAATATTTAPPPPRRTRRRVASPGSAGLRVASQAPPTSVASPPPDTLPSLDGPTLATPATAATLLDWFAVAPEDDQPPPLLSDSEDADEPGLGLSHADGSSRTDPQSRADGSSQADGSSRADGSSLSQDLIPCEICSEMVPFVRYTDHVEDCLVRQRTRLRQRALASLPQMAIRRLTATDPQHDGLHIQLFAPAAQTQVASLFHQLGFQILADALSHDGSGNDYEQNLAIRDMLGDVVPPGLDNAAKEAATRPLDAAAVVGRDATCTICMDALPKADCAHYRETPCRHVFCEPCLYRWLDDHHQCPNCLQSLRPTPDENLAAIE